MNKNRLEFVSIPAPGLRSNLGVLRFLISFSNFDPRSPYGERFIVMQIMLTLPFQSPLSVRGAIWRCGPHHFMMASKLMISIHAPRLGNNRQPIP